MEKPAGNDLVLWLEGTGEGPWEEGQTGAAQGPRVCPETCTLRGAYSTLTLTSPGSCIFTSDPLGRVAHIPQTPQVPASAYHPCPSPFPELP